MTEIMSAPDKESQDLLRKPNAGSGARSKEGRFYVGAKYGKGFMLCRRARWLVSAAAVRVEGGSVGFQIGGSETDVVFLVMNQGGVKKLFRANLR